MFDFTFLQLVENKEGKNHFHLSSELIFFRRNFRVHDESKLKNDRVQHEYDFLI